MNGGFQSGQGYMSDPPMFFGSAIIPPPLTPLEWWDPAIQAYQDTGTATPATANNAPIGHLVGQMGYGQLVNTGATDRPLLQTAQINGLPTMKFDGINDFIAGTFAWAVPLTVYMLVRMDTYLLNCTIFADPTPTNLYVFMSSTSPTLGFYGGQNGVGATNTDLAVGTYGILSMVVGGGSTSNKMRINLGTRYTGGQSGNFTSEGGISLAKSAATGFTAETVGRIAIYNTNHSDADNTTVVTAFKTLYGI